MPAVFQALDPVTEGSTHIITGTLGGGKSLMAVDRAMDHLSRGGTVITNIPIFREKVAAWMLTEFGLIMEQDRLVLLEQASIRNFFDVAKRGNSKNTVMMVLDEAALDINAKDHQDLPREMFNFVVLCRKLIIDLVLIAQDANDVARQIRGKMQKETHCRSLKNLPVVGETLKGLPVFIRVHYTIEVGKKAWRTGAKFHWKAQSWGMFDSLALHGEKAKAFGALDQAKDSDLQRLHYAAWPYALASFLAAFTSCFTCLLAN